MFETLKKRYEQKYVRKDQLRQYVALGLLTEEEFLKIVTVA